MINCCSHEWLLFPALKLRGILRRQQQQQITGRSVLTWNYQGLPTALAYLSSDLQWVPLVATWQGQELSKLIPIISYQLLLPWNLQIGPCQGQEISWLMITKVVVPVASELDPLQVPLQMTQVVFCRHPISLVDLLHCQTWAQGGEALEQLLGTASMKRGAATGDLQRYHSHAVTELNLKMQPYLPRIISTVGGDDAFYFLEIK